MRPVRSPRTTILVGPGIEQTSSSSPGERETLDYLADVLWPEIAPGTDSELWGPVETALQKGSLAPLKELPPSARQRLLGALEDHSRRRFRAPGPRVVVTLARILQPDLEFPEAWGRSCPVRPLR